MAYLHLNSCNKYQKIHKSCDIHPVDTNQEINVTIKNRQYLIRVFKCIHTVPTVGFGVAELRKRIKPEYASSSKAEIVATKKSGEEISVLTEVPLFCFLGDTTDKVFSLHPEIFNYPNIIVECTFLEKEEQTEAKKRRHMHWDNLQPIINDHPDIFFVLIHFSLRYNDEEVKKFFNGKLLPNMVAWTDRELIKQ